MTLSEQDIRNAAILECAAIIRQCHEQAKPPIHISSDHAEASLWKAAMFDCLAVAAKFLRHGGRATPAEVLAIQQAVFDLLDEKRP